MSKRHQIAIAYAAALQTPGGVDEMRARLTPKEFRRVLSIWREVRSRGLRVQ